LYTFARSRRRGEFAGATFSPDGGTLFVNMQNEGLTLAIAGPWRHHDLGRKS
jgi:secreted PhoX family phosphatase